MLRSVPCSAALLAAGAFFCLLALSGPATRAGSASPQAALAQLPLSFEENRGQAAPATRFLARGPGCILELGATGSTLTLAARPAGEGGAAAPQSATLRTEVVGVDPRARVRGGARLPGRVNYLLGNDPRQWR